MFGRPRKEPAGDLAQFEVAPWEGESLKAEWGMISTPKRKREVAGVVLTSGDQTFQMLETEVLRLVEHKVETAQSVPPTGSPTAFLTWPASAPKSSIVGELVAAVPRQSLVLLVEPMDEGIQAVVTGDELRCFQTWC